MSSPSACPLRAKRPAASLSSPAISAMSAPATKALSPAPVSTATRTSGCAASAVKASVSSSITRALSALSFSGRWITTVAT